MESFIARQPILDSKKNVAAYELLFRDGVTNAASIEQPTNGTQASSHVMTNALTLFGLETLANNKKAFIKMTRDVLIQQLPLAFDTRTLVIEILGDVPADDAVVEVCAHYKKLGYTLAMDNVIHGETRDALLNLTDIVKIDFMQTNQEQQRELATRFWSNGKILLAEKVETIAEFEFAMELDFTLFQGYFFAKPELLTRKDVRANKINSLRLISALQPDDPDLATVEQIIKNDVAISYRLLRYINSAFFSFRVEISSIRQAMVLLGNREFKKWANLIAMSGLTDDKPEELMITGLIRARFFELLATGMRLSDEAENLFLLGIFSILDGATDQSFEAIFKEIPLKPKIRDALLANTGPYAPLIGAMQAFEQGNWKVFSRFVHHHQAIDGTVTEHYLQAVEWANQNMAAISKKTP